MATKTKESQRRADYDSHVRRRKVYLPVIPFGLAPDNTTTDALGSRGDQVCRIEVVASNYVAGAIMDAANDEVVFEYKVPDEFYEGDPLYVWIVWSREDASTTGVISYDCKYSTKRIVDWGGSGTAEALAAPTTAMDTDLDEAVTCTLTTYATQNALYRSMRGQINGGKVEIGDMMQFKVEADAAPTNGARFKIHGLEIEYSLRLKGEAIEAYE